MPDFTLDTFKKLLETLLSKDYSFQTFAQYLKEPAHRSVILRHDVDAGKLNSLQTARLEYEMGIAGTYYFRMVPESFDEAVIKHIHELGHEIGYHYEDVSTCAARGRRFAARSSELPEDPLPGGARGGFNETATTEAGNGMAQGTGRRAKGRKELQDQLVTDAITSFKKNLEILRRIVPVETICMHGSPLSRWDNRIMWQYYDYHDYGITGEPYFDLDFNKVLYLTDTGRRWDGESVSVRDKAPGSGLRAPGKERLKYEDANMPEIFSSPQPGTWNQELGTPSFRTSFDIIRAANSHNLPDSIMLTVHPQRWTNKPLPWLLELIWQNVKNIGKGMIVTSSNKKG